MLECVRQVRDFKKASAQLLDSVATFTATELLPYNQFVLYTVIASLISLPRADLKSKVVDAPEILQVIGEIPHLSGLVDGMYTCQYRTLMRSLVEIIDVLKADRFLSEHARYYWREVRGLPRDLTRSPTPRYTRVSIVPCPCRGRCA